MTHQEPRKGEVAETYRSHDLGCSAVLICAGFTLLNINYQPDAKRALFVFQKQNGINETINDFLSNRLKVNAREYVDTIRALKSRLYNN